jgi:NAD(P)H-dependent FMN reductase
VARDPLSRVLARRSGRTGDVIDKLTIQILVGSVREGRKSLPIARWVFERATLRSEFKLELVDLAKWALPMLALAKPPAARVSKT